MPPSPAGWTPILLCLLCPRFCRTEDRSDWETNFKFRPVNRELLLQACPYPPELFPIP